MKSSFFKISLTIAILGISTFMYSQIPGPGDPIVGGGGGGGASVPIDGGLIMGLLAVGGVLSAFLKKNKKEDN